MADLEQQQMYRIKFGWTFSSEEHRVVALVAREEPPHVRTLLFGEGLWATPEELEEWHAAAVTYLSDVAAAEAEWRHVDQRWGRRRRARLRWLPLGGGWLGRDKIRLAQERFVHRLRAASAAYEPTLQQVEHRLAEYEAAEREQKRRRQEELAALQQAASARYREWRRREDAFAAAADLPGFEFTVDEDVVRVHWRPEQSRTARELAAAVLTEPDLARRSLVWDSAARAQVESLVGAGRFDPWWERLHASVRNVLARDEATQSVIGAIEQTSTALEAAGRPGISTIRDKPSNPIQGWIVEVDWSHLPEVAPSDFPPDVPSPRIEDWGWSFGTYEPSLLQRMYSEITLQQTSYRAGYDIVRVHSYDMSGWGTQYRWFELRPADFAGYLFDDEIRRDECTIRLTEHADPAVFVPYVRAIADAIAEALTGLVRECGA